MKRRSELPSGSTPLSEALRAKGRRRRLGYRRMSEAQLALRSPRNDLLPRLEVSTVPLSELKASLRKLRRLDPVHVRDVANSILAFGFCEPLLIDGENNVVHGETRLEAAKLVGLDRVSCITIDHLNSEERRLLRLAVNRLAEKGEWDLDNLKIEFEELIVAEAPIELSGFVPNEVEHIILDDSLHSIEHGPVEPDVSGEAIARGGDIFMLGQHRIACGDARDPEILRRLMGNDPAARLILTDEPYNVLIAGNVTGQEHREFQMASGEMTAEQFQAFNEAWVAAALPNLCEGGVLGTFIDWRGQPTVHAAATKLDLAPLNLIVWAKTNAGMGSLYRSQHELLPLFRKAAHRTSITSNWGGRVVGDLTYGPIPAPHRLVLTPAAVCRSIQQSSRQLCWRTPSWT